MAQHISSIAASGIAQLGADDFRKAAHTGMLLFASHRNNNPVSAAIRGETHSCLTHVGMIDVHPLTQKRLLLESLFPYGAGVGLLDHYLDPTLYDGDLVLAQLDASLSSAGKWTMWQSGVGAMQAQFRRPYDWQDEVVSLLHKAMPFVHPERGDEDHRCYCSAYMATGLKAAGFTIQEPADGSDVTPEGLWLHDFVQPVYACVQRGGK